MYTEVVFYYKKHVHVSVINSTIHDLAIPLKKTDSDLAKKTSIHVTVIDDRLSYSGNV